MRHVAIRITDEEAQNLLAWAQAEEDEAAADQGRKPRKITLATAARGCFVEGLTDLEVRRA